MGVETTWPRHGGLTSRGVGDAIQGEVRSYLVIVCEVRRQHAVKMAFAQHDDVVQAFATNRTDDSFHVRILPGRSRGAGDFLDRHAPHAILEILAKDPFPISQQKTWRLVVRKRVDDLLRGPLRIGMGRDAKVNNFSSMMPKYDENVEHSKRRRRNGEEVARRRLGHVIAQKCLPSLRRRLARAHHVLGDRPLGHVVSQESQFRTNSRRSPSRILA